MTDSHVLGTWVGTGETGTGEGAGQIIEIEPEFDAVTSLHHVETYVFVTYSSATRAPLVSDEPQSYRLQSYSNRSGDSVTGTAMLFQMTGTPVNVYPLKLRLVFPPAEPVRWRAVAVRVAGFVTQTRDVSWRSAENVPPVPVGGLGLMFFGFTDTQLNYTGSVMNQVAVYPQTDPGASGDTGDIVVLSWHAGAVRPAVTGGPWYTAVVSLFVPQPPPPGPGERPPPTDADSFWAVRACCTCADVFLINDFQLAQRWDEPGSAALITLDTLLLNHTDADGTRWSLTDIDGWWTLPPPELPELKRSGYLDGSFPVDGRYGARQITVSGAFIPGEGLSLAVPRQRLLRALDAVREGALFVVKEPVWAKQAWVYLEGQPKLSTKSRSQLTIFEFALRAVDPIKYHAGIEGLQKILFTDQRSAYLGRNYEEEGREDGQYTQEAVLRGARFRNIDPPPPAGDVSVAPNPYRRYNDQGVSSGVMLAMNAGTTNVFPRFYIYGPCVNPVLRNDTTGQEMRFTCSIASGEMLVVDCYWRSVMSRNAEPDISLHPLGDVNGSNRRWYLDFMSQWIGLAPGENVVQLSASSFPEEASMVMAFRSGWLG